MNKFAKYVPEADKKKQREHIGAMGMADMPFGEKEKPLTVFEITDREIPWEEFCNGYYTDEIPDGVELMVGNKYTIIYNGTRYENLEVTEVTNVETPFRFIGAEQDIDTGSYHIKDGCPVSIVYVIQDGYVALVIVEPYDDNGQILVSVSLETTETIIKTIDPKYLPSNIGGGLLHLYYADDDYLYRTVDALSDYNPEDRITLEELRAAMYSGGVIINGWDEMLCYPSEVMFFDDFARVTWDNGDTSRYTAGYVNRGPM